MLERGSEIEDGRVRGVLRGRCGSVFGEMRAMQAGDDVAEQPLVSRVELGFGWLTCATEFMELSLICGRIVKDDRRGSAPKQSKDGRRPELAKELLLR
jgi:hypothetical protein